MVSKIVTCSGVAEIKSRIDPVLESHAILGEETARFVDATVFPSSFFSIFSISKSGGVL